MVDLTKHEKEVLAEADKLFKAPIGSIDWHKDELRRARGNLKHFSPAVRADALELVRYHQDEIDTLIDAAKNEGHNNG